MFSDLGVLLHERVNVRFLFALMNDAKFRFFDPRISLALDYLTGEQRILIDRVCVSHGVAAMQRAYVFVAERREIKRDVILVRWNFLGNHESGFFEGAQL